MKNIKKCKCGCEKPFLDDDWSFEEGMYFLVICPECKKESKHCDTAEKAIADWNRRQK